MEQKLTIAVRNPENTKKELLRYPYYHPLYCDVFGHTLVSSIHCKMKQKTKGERKVILDAIAYQRGIDTSTGNGKFNNLRVYGTMLKYSIQSCYN